MECHNQKQLRDELIELTTAERREYEAMRDRFTNCTMNSPS